MPFSNVSQSQNPAVKLLGLNVCGLYAKLNLGILERYIQKFNIVCFCETKSNIIGNDDFPGFKPYVKKNFHGICTLIKTNISHNVMQLLETQSDHVLWLHIKKECFGKEFILGSVYLPHENSTHYHEDMFDNIEEDIMYFNVNFSNVPVIMLGDFNSRTGLQDDFLDIDHNVVENSGFLLDENYLVFSKQNLEELGIITDRFNQDNVLNRNGKRLIESCRNLNLKIVNGRFGKDRNIGSFTCMSHNGNSLVDYALVSPDLLSCISDFEVDSLDHCLSDIHRPICLELSFIERKSNDVKIIQIEYDTTSQNNIPSGSDIIFLKHQGEPSLAIEYRNNINSNEILMLNECVDSTAPESVNQALIDSIASDICKLFLDAAKKVGVSNEIVINRNKKSLNGQKYSSSKSQPWFNNVCKKKRSEYFKLKRLSTKNPEKLNDFKEFSKEYKKLIRKTSKKYYDALHGNLRDVKCTNSKEYWRILNTASKKLSLTSQVSIETFYEHFKKLNQTENNVGKDNEIALDFTHTNDYIDDLFTFNELKLAIKKLKNGKACGIDNVTNEFIKHCSEETLVMILKFFNMVLSTGIVPKEWCLGIIKPLYKKKGSAADPDNYRGITLLSCISKLFTAMINYRLTNYLEGIGVIGCEQIGFREGYSTMDHLFVLSSIINLYLFKSRRLYCAFIDYKKAFDLVERSSLWIKLLSSGISGRVLRVIHNIYDNAKSCVKVNNEFSDTFSCNIGVRQGENLSPLLFSLYLNDFENFIRSKFNGLNLLSDDIKRFLSDDDTEIFLRLYTLLYADDTVVFAESPNELQKALNAVDEYCRQWHLVVNTKKTKIVIFSKGKVRNIPIFYFNGVRLDVDFDFTYLGCNLNYNGKFKKAISKQVSQARCAMFSLVTKSRKLKLPVDMQCELFDRLVIPVLLYGCELWGCENIDAINLFYRKFLKSLLKVKRSTSNCMVFGEMGKYPLKTVIDKRVLNFWLHLAKGNSNKLSCTFIIL